MDIKRQLVTDGFVIAKDNYTDNVPNVVRLSPRLIPNIAASIIPPRIHLREDFVSGIGELCVHE